MMEETSSSIGSEKENSVGNFQGNINDDTMDISYDLKPKRKSESDILASQLLCYKRLSDLLEKSKKYTTLLCERIEKDDDSFSMLLKVKSEQIMKQAQNITEKSLKNIPEVKKGGRKRKRDIDQVVPEQQESSSTSSTSSSEHQDKSSGNDSTDVRDDGLKYYNQPMLVTGGELRKYQLNGVSWLMKLYLNGVNGILADEMGLGKTIQCVSLISDLICIGASGPFLICCPLSTLLNWSNEFKKFAPAVPCITYYGNKDERLAMVDAILKPVGLPGHDLRCRPVVITSFEVAIKDKKHLGRIAWDLLIVDEGHRLKNSNCRLIRELKTYNASHRLLLTGTPLQNNLSELWTLLNFLIPEIFNSSGSFETWFDVDFLENVDNADEQIAMEEGKTSTLSKIHQILTPFMLRRLKKDVDIVIPPKKELLVIAPFAPKQKILYKSILDKTISQMLGTNEEKEESNDGAIALIETPRLRGKKPVNYSLAFEDGNNEEEDESSLMSWAEAVVTDKVETAVKESDAPKFSQPCQLRNILSLLRKCCNHPCLLRSQDDDFSEELIIASGKLHLMDRMLSKLKSWGHRVLIFSQSTQLLDVLGDYCTFRNYSICRLDGRMPISERQKEIQRYSEEDVFVFLLSTRAGGLGINLTKADTVIIYDSDWNPQCDLQAQDRCHRIGQNNPVVVYRLVAGGSVDQKIVERASAKRKLEKMIIHKDKFKLVEQNKLVDPQELLNILKESDYQDVVRDVGMSEQDLHKLLDRSDLRRTWEEQKLGKVQNSLPTKEGAMSLDDQQVSNPYFKLIDDLDE